MVEGLPPSVQHGGDTDPGSQVLRIGGDRGQRLRRGLEQEPVDLGLVLVGDGTECRRQGEDQVVVGGRQELRLACLQPGLSRHPLALGAMPVAAGIVGDAGVGAGLALLDMAAERGGTAELDRAHDAPLGEAEMPLVRGAPGGPVAAEDVRHLELRPGHAAGVMATSCRSDCRGLAILTGDGCSSTATVLSDDPVWVAKVTLCDT
jgi:hypothetical protein